MAHAPSLQYQEEDEKNPGKAQRVRPKLRSFGQNPGTIVSLPKIFRAYILRQTASSVEIGTVLYRP